MNTTRRFDFRLMALAGIALAGAAQAQWAVSNVTFQLLTDGSKKVEIRYAVGGGVASYNISVQVSNDGDKSYLDGCVICQSA